MLLTSISTVGPPPGAKVRQPIGAHFSCFYSGSSEPRIGVITSWAGASITPALVITDQKNISEGFSVIKLHMKWIRST